MLKTVPPEIRYCHIFTGFCKAYRQDELHVPGLPDMALRLRKALEVSIARIVDIINLDPVVSSKLIQVANSPLYWTLGTVTHG